MNTKLTDERAIGVIVAHVRRLQSERDALRKLLIHVQEERNRLLAEAERLRAAIDTIAESKPDGFAYLYHSGHGGSTIRFNNGEEVNGGRPHSTVPYHLGVRAKFLAALDAKDGA